MIAQSLLAVLAAACFIPSLVAAAREMARSFMWALPLLEVWAISVQQLFPAARFSTALPPGVQPSLFAVPAKGYSQGCGVLHRDRNSSICASVANMLAGPPVKCLISDCLLSRIESSSRRCKKDWWGVKQRTQRLFAIETEYVRVKAFCFVHASGAKYGRVPIDHSCTTRCTHHSCTTRCTHRSFPSLTG